MSRVLTSDVNNISSLVISISRHDAECPGGPPIACLAQLLHVIFME